MRKNLLFLLLALPGLASCELSVEDFPDVKNKVDSDEVLIKYFSNIDFTCENESDFTPKESPEATQAFWAFINYVNEGSKIKGYWNEKEHQQKRDGLLTAAVKVGSWKADYLESVWDMSGPRESPTVLKAQKRLRKLAYKGIPIAAYKYATPFYGWDSETFYYLMSEAIKRGSPHAMTKVGNIIAHRDKMEHLYPIGKQLLECAASQNFANAYGSLGRITYYTGHKLKAYQLWETGANKGCEDCIDRMGDLAKVRRGYAPHVMPLDLMPELRVVKDYYDYNYFYRLTELPELQRSEIPDNMKFHASKFELFLLLQRYYF